MEGRTQVTDYDISWSADHSQYWQGAGVAYTRYSEIATGIGSTKRESVEDALEQVAQQSFDIPGIDSSEWSETYICDNEGHNHTDEAEADQCEFQYFTVIRFNAPDEATPIA